MMHYYLRLGPIKALIKSNQGYNSHIIANNGLITAFYKSIIMILEKKK